MVPAPLQTSSPYASSLQGKRPNLHQRRRGR
jgi:hypothetical protein